MNRPNSAVTPSQLPATSGVPVVERLRDLSSQQWKSGIAAWLGWLFDGLDMHLYTIIAAPFVAQLLQVASPADPLVKEKSSWIQAAFLIGWALGGGFFGRIGDRLGRSRTLSLTILTYALFTGLSFLAQTWWQLLIFRFVAALGIGGEWAVGASLLSETWPKRWRPWIAAVLQTGVNIGVLLACATTYWLAAYPQRYVFLVGILPALMVFWIRRSVPETEEWHTAKMSVEDRGPGVADLFRGRIRWVTLLTILVCATSLTAWWAFMFWNQQHLRNLPELSSWPVRQREQLISRSFFMVISSSILGNFLAAGLARVLGYRRAISLMCLGFFLATFGAYSVPRDHASLLVWTSAIGFFSGVFGLFTMYLPPLFPTLLRTTGAGFCYNIGRVAAAFGTVFFGLFSQVGDFRIALLSAGFLFLPAALVVLLMPELSADGTAVRSAGPIQSNR
ncbi:MAG: MFS transporter [Verrucomicrobia bacterium]|nr:MFS transporter [Verrucomicrobiota bacterium]